MSTSVVRTAADRRREVFAAVATAHGSADAVDALSRLLGVSESEAREVLAAPLEEFVGPEGSEAGSSASGGSGFALQPFRADDETHVEIFHRRSSDSTSATAGEWDSSRTESERAAGLERMDSESAMWFVAVDTTRDRPVGLVFGEETGDGDVDFAIWVAPEERKKGYGMYALRACRREFAAFFPGRSVVVRAPLSASGE